MTVRDLLEDGTARLATSGIASARAEVEWLLAEMLGVGRFRLYLDIERPLPEAVARRFAAAVSRRAAREPLQQILGRQAFCDVSVTVTPDVLVPRPETERLVEWALETLPWRPARGRPLVVDVGTGSGCVACAIASARPDADVVAVDLSPAAAAVARANAESLGLAERVRALIGDLLAPVGAARADLVVANLPYLPRASLAGLEPEVREHEPALALDGGADGLDVIRRLVADAPRVLRPGGRLVLETAGGAQATAVAALLGRAGFHDVAVRRDLAGVGRFVGGTAHAVGAGQVIGGGGAA
ncbi:MAG: peptide chain release factor N(5)-glutamine methyltransferase [Candidatus Rokubacteria bacterium]|nr:peptide chain release factor N(5)-glutamine methyltransferase [Candidatus Rokubacteria bacterium]MBI3825415.1 peptide chain release factor N(5)-glutamine methyltransferase [Candidatus Rokubacteria bacterium]